MADATLLEAAALAGIDLSADCLARYLHAIGLRSHVTIAAYMHEDAVVTDGCDSGHHRVQASC